MLAERGGLDAAWPESVQTRRLQLVRLAARLDPDHALQVDGRFGGLVLYGEMSRLGEATVPRLPAPASTEGFPGDLTTPFAGARLLERAALEPVRVWDRLAARLEADPDLPPVPPEWWSDLRLPAPGPGADPEDVRAAEYARAQGERVLALQGLSSGLASELASRLASGLPAELNEGLLEIRLGELDWMVEGSRPLALSWRLLDLLYQVSEQYEAVPGPVPVDNGAARQVADWMEAHGPADAAALRAIDPELLVVHEILREAARSLVAGEPRAWVRGELAHAYARLALFLPDADAYLDQPVRQGIMDRLNRCVSSGLVFEPPSRSTFEACLSGLFELLDGGLGSDELTGTSAGTFAEEFLRREMDLSAWQRVDYLVGHLNWLLSGTCTQVASQNRLEWSVLTEALYRWAPLRPAYFSGARWQTALDASLEAGRREAARTGSYLDCLAAPDAGARPGDVFSRLLDRYRREMELFEVALGQAAARFREQYLRPGSDVSLEPGGLPDQFTAYRPEQLMLEPCDPATACGARVTLPVSRALVGLFPNAHLLADQLNMGRIRLCYDRVGWVDRRQAPARKRDPLVANYHGRLRFELVGAWVDTTDGQEPVPTDPSEEVFRLRFTDDQERIYFFSGADPEVLHSECPLDRVGEPVASERDVDGLPLVPNRLTYFSSAPTTPERLLSANWERGAEWRDWFLGTDRVEVVHRADGDALMGAVTLRLEELSGLRERQLAQSMLRTHSPTVEDPLASAMVRLTDLSGLMRRTAELFYPVRVRHDPVLRGALAGDQGLIGRDRVRLLRDAGEPMLRTAIIARERLEALDAYWRSLPAPLRNQGQLSPELVRGLEDLRRLERLSAAPLPPAPGEGPADPGSTP